MTTPVADCGPRFVTTMCHVNALPSSRRSGPSLTICRSACGFGFTVVVVDDELFDVLGSGWSARTFAVLPTVPAAWAVTTISIVADAQELSAAIVHVTVRVPGA